MFAVNVTYDFGVSFRIRVIFFNASSLNIAIISFPVIAFFCLTLAYNFLMQNFQGNYKNGTKVSRIVAELHSIYLQYVDGQSEQQVIRNYTYFLGTQTSSLQFNYGLCLLPVELTQSGCMDQGCNKYCRVPSTWPYYWTLRKNWIEKAKLELV